MLFIHLGRSVLYALHELTIMSSKLNELPSHLMINQPGLCLLYPPLIQGWVWFWGRLLVLAWRVVGFLRRGGGGKKLDGVFLLVFFLSQPIILFFHLLVVEFCVKLFRALDSLMWMLHWWIKIMLVSTYIMLRYWRTLKTPGGKSCNWLRDKSLSTRNNHRQMVRYALLDEV